MDRYRGIARVAALLGIAGLLAASPAPMVPPDPPVIVAVAPNPLIQGQSATLLVRTDASASSLSFFAVTTSGDVALSSVAVTSRVSQVQIPAYLVNAAVTSGLRAAVGGTIGAERTVTIDQATTGVQVTELVVEGIEHLEAFHEDELDRIRGEVLDATVGASPAEVEALVDQAEPTVGGLSERVREGIDSLVSAGKARLTQLQQAGGLSSDERKLRSKDFDQFGHKNKEAATRRGQSTTNSIQSFKPTTTLAALASLWPPAIAFGEWSFGIDSMYLTFTMCTPHGPGPYFARIEIEYANGQKSTTWAAQLPGTCITHTVKVEPVSTGGKVRVTIQDNSSGNPQDVDPPGTKSKDFP